MQNNNTKIGRTLCVGDIHGNYKALKQVLKRANFDYNNDTLISLGDVVDGHSESYEVVEELLKIKNLIKVKGNHDDWFREWIETGINPTRWKQGQKETGLSYLKHIDPELPWFTYIKRPGLGEEVVETLKPIHVPLSHKIFFKEQIPYYRDSENRLFIHGGFDRNFYLEDQSDYTFWWDRILWKQALSFKAMSGNPTGRDERWKPKFRMIEKFKEVYIGHTSTQFWEEDFPMNAANIWNLDTGAGWFGYLSVMDIDTKEVWQSDSAKELYPEFKGRR